MSSSEERPRSWRAEPEATSATGGHLSPGMDATGPLFDPLFDPLPSEGETAPRPPRTSRFDSAAPAEAPRVPSDVLGSRPAPEPGVSRRRPSRRGPRPAVRRVKRTIKRVDPFSALKLSLFYYSCFLIVWLGIVAVIYWIVESMGLFDAIETVGTAFAVEWSGADISLWLVERWAMIIGVGLVILGSLINAFLAVLYNLASDVVGGLEVTFVERDL